MHLLFIGAVRALVLVASLVVGTAFAHEGHDHDATTPLVNQAISPRAEASSEAFELLLVARETALLIYLDRFRTNEPVEGATVQVDTPAGFVIAAARAGEPYMLPAPWLRPGNHDLLFTVSAGADVDVLTATLVIPENVAQSSAAASASLIGSAFATELKQILSASDSALIAAVFAGFVIGVAVTGVALRRRRTPALGICLTVVAALASTPVLAHEGEDHSEPKGATVQAPVRDLAQRLSDGTVFVPKSSQRILSIRTILTEPGVFRRTVELPGRIIPDPNASGFVQASAGGRLSPAPGGFPRLGTPVKQGDVLAFVTAPLQAIDVSTMRQQAGDLDQQISIVERRVARYEQLAQTGAGTRTQLDEARLELQGLRQRRAALDRTQREPEALIAPVSGIVAEANAVAGQMAQPSEKIFQIVDPERLWVEALSFDALAGGQSATARTSSGQNFALKYQGSGFADRNQAVPVHFAVDGDTRGLRAGQFVTVLAETDQERRGLALPRKSIVRGANGQDLVYEHTAAERFGAREVRVEPLDGDRVLVSAGTATGRRVVTQGAELLDQVR
jgi:membrane fusion protein, heavy metal efflux system